ncbi:MAG: 2-C-methyl-D-erythritol 4-phosphate cytidylyltransferase [Bacteroidia bacterium]
MANVHLILVAGGIGSRMKANKPKQLLLLNKKPVFVYALEKFFNVYPKINVVVAAHAESKIEIQKNIKKYFKNANVTIIEGGPTRFHSVKNALAAIKDKGIIAVHDAARPLVSGETIKRTFETAKRKGNAIPAIAVSESVRVLKNNISKAIDRDTLRIIQTPQCFDADLLRKAYKSAKGSKFTDDASVIEKLGLKINLVEGNKENLKITEPDDLIKAAALLKYVK